MTTYRVQRRIIEETFTTFRLCGDNHRECQLYWLSPHSNPLIITEVVHPQHWSSRFGLSIQTDWIDLFWHDLVNRGLGVRVQVHTHPAEAFHSTVDDRYPLLFSAGFLSLVIPNFAMGQVGFDDAYLTEIQADGSWGKVEIATRLHIDG